MNICTLEQSVRVRDSVHFGTYFFVVVVVVSLSPGLINNFSFYHIWSNSYFFYLVKFLFFILVQDTSNFIRLLLVNKNC